MFWCSSRRAEGAKSLEPTRGLEPRTPSLRDAPGNLISPALGPLRCSQMLSNGVIFAEFGTRFGTRLRPRAPASGAAGAAPWRSNAGSPRGPQGHPSSGGRPGHEGCSAQLARPDDGAPPAAPPKIGGRRATPDIGLLFRGSSNRGNGGRNSLGAGDSALRASREACTGTGPPVAARHPSVKGAATRLAPLGPDGPLLDCRASLRRSATRAARSTAPA